MLYSQKNELRITFMQRFTCAGIAGSVAKTLTSPLDVLKVRFQLGTQETVPCSYPRAIIKLYRTEGVGALWKGNFIGCLRIIPYSVIQLLAFQRIKLTLSDRFGRLTPLSAAVAGAGGGLLATAIMYPSETIKTRLIAQHMCPRIAHYNGIVNAAITIYTSEGLLTFYRGLCPTLLGTIPFSGAMFLAYEILDKLWERYHLGIKDNTTKGLINGCVSGMFAQTITFPFDTIRKRMQAYSDVLWDKGNVDLPSKTVKETTEGIIRKSGARGLWRGCVASNIKIIPYTGLMFYTYEVCKNFFVYHNGYTTCPIENYPMPGIDQNESPSEVGHLSDEDIY